MIEKNYLRQFLRHLHYGATAGAHNSLPYFPVHFFNLFYETADLIRAPVLMFVSAALTNFVNTAVQINQMPALDGVLIAIGDRL